MYCEDCHLANKETVCGNGITEPPYLTMYRCPYDKEYYHYGDDGCLRKLTEKGKKQLHADFYVGGKLCLDQLVKRNTMNLKKDTEK